MKVTYNPKTGEMSFDVVSPNDLNIARKLMGKPTANGHSAPPVDFSRPQAPQVAVPQTEEIPVSDVAYETWQWLVANDAEGGVALKDIAAGTQTNQGLASQRLKTLIKAGLAHKVSRGRYRAG